MKELMLIRNRISDEYEHVIHFGDTYLEADGLLAALKVIDERIDEIIEKAGI